jgi:hypothetical protein
LASSLSATKARAAELHGIDVHAYHLTRRSNAPSKWPEDAHCPASQIEASPAGHRAEVIEPRLAFRLPDARLETEPLQLRGAVG